MKRILELLLMAYALTGTISIAASQMSMGLAGIAALLDRGRSLSWARMRNGVEGPIAAWIGVSLLATLFASQPWASFLKMKKLALFAMLYWPPAVVSRSWNLGRLFVFLLFAAGVTSLYGVTTFLWQGGPEWGAVIRGLHGFYLTNSGLLLLCTFPALTLGMCPTIAPSFRCGAALAALAILCSQVLSCLPGTWVGTAAGFFALALRTRSARIALLGAALIVFVVLGPPVFSERLGQFLDPRGDFRTGLERTWRSAARLFVADPWTGWGLHDLRAEFEAVKKPGDPTEGHMRSVPWQIAVSMGVPGLAAFLWLVVGWFRLLNRARASAPTPFARAVIEGTEASLVAFLAAGLLEWNFGDSEILALLAFLLGASHLAGRLDPDPRAAG
jgi:hypothetical protein